MTRPMISSEYAGEDLRNAVMSDVNHYLSTSIEKEVKKRVRSHKKKKQPRGTP